MKKSNFLHRLKFIDFKNIILIIIDNIYVDIPSKLTYLNRVDTILVHSD